MSLPSFDDATDIVLKTEKPSTHERVAKPKVYVCSVCKSNFDKETDEKKKKDIRYAFDLKSSYTNHMYTHSDKLEFKNDIERIMIPWKRGAPSYDPRKKIYGYPTGFDLPEGYQLLDLNRREVKVIDHKEYIEAILIKEGKKA